MIKKITQKHYQQLIKDADIIEKDVFGVKVLDTKKGEMIKLFRRKRLLSTALFKPYAVRFVDNAKQLTALGIPTITVNKLFWCSSIIIFYRSDMLYANMMAGDLPYIILLYCFSTTAPVQSLMRWS